MPDNYTDEGIPVIIVSRNAEGTVTFRCEHCRKKHTHGGGGHKIAHCAKPNSPYKTTGYILKVVDDVADRLVDLQERAFTVTHPEGISPYRAALAEWKSISDEVYELVKPWGVETVSACQRSFMAWSKARHGKPTAEQQPSYHTILTRRGA